MRKGYLGSAEILSSGIHLSSKIMPSLVDSTARHIEPQAGNDMSPSHLSRSHMEMATSADLRYLASLLSSMVNDTRLRVPREDIPVELLRPLLEKIPDRSADLH